MRVFIFLLLVILQTAVNASNVYVFYRGYHFLADQDPLDDLTPRGIRSRPIPSTMTEDTAQALIRKVQSLQRPWTQAELSRFHSSCFSPLADLVQLYTNNYKNFTQELKDPQSRTRRILRLANLEIDSNPFISTSLKALQAVKYGGGLKLFGHDELRRYPCYQDSGNPTNTQLGFLDIIVIPEEDIMNTGAFFVVESFARGDTALSYHWSKKLTEEQEVLFPFFISRKYHRERLFLSVPPLNKPFSGLRPHRWLADIRQANEEERSGIELRLITRLSEIGADIMEKRVATHLKSRGLHRLFVSPSFVYTERRLVPDDAARMRNQILTKVNAWGKKYERQGNYLDSINITRYLRNPRDRFIKAYAFRHLGLTVPLDIEVDDLPFDGVMSFEVLSILGETPGLRRFSLRGPDTEGIFPEEYDEDLDSADLLIPLAEIHNIDPWRYPPNDFDQFIKALQRRNKQGYPLIAIDVTGQRLAPSIWNELSEVATLEDENREADEEAVERAAIIFEGYQDVDYSDGDFEEQEFTDDEEY